MPKTTDASQARHERTNDKLLELPEIAETIRMTEASIRWKRHRGEMPFVFKMSRRLVAWESDVVGYIESFRIAEQAERNMETA
jgi:predicted DNA-binding transcriptional regulator AlpA